MKKFFLLFLCTALCSFSAFSQNPNISGPISLCDAATTQSYTVDFFGSTTNGRVTIVGGVISGTPTGTGGSGCGPIIVSLGSNKFEAITNNTCDITVSFDVIWNSTATTRKIEARDLSTPTTITQNIFIHSSSSAYISGPGNYVCQSFTGGTFYANNIKSPSTRQWSATSTGSPLTISSPTGFQTYISGFTPNNFYTINCAIYCDGVFKKNISYILVTGNSCRIGPSALAPNTALHRLSGDDIQPSGNNQNDLSGNNETPLIQQSVVKLSTGLKIFPNPLRADQPLNINLPEELGIEQVSIVNSKGQIVEQVKVKGLLSYSFNLNDLPNGVYTVVFKGNFVQQARKIILME